MKKFFKYMFVALMATATLGFAACSDDDKDNTVSGSDLPTYESLEGTQWEGSYTTTTQTPQGTMPLSIRWTLNFLANGRASVMFIFDSQAFDNTPYDWSSTYTYNPSTGTGKLSDEYLGDVNFTTDAINRTLTANLVIYVQHEEGDSGYPYGGETTLHQTR
ncbi:MAG: hypothetical protein IJ634_06960 [Bacteroidales bacterium]|nr:hypothetical protein [Bacteroidales bacterium]